MLRRLMRLSRQELSLLAGAFLRLVAARIALKLWPSSPLCRRQVVASATSRQEFTASQAAWAVGAVADRLPGTGCLARALALRGLLGSAGYSSMLRIGVAKGADGSIRAHAWISCDETEFDCGEDPGRYSPFPALPG